MVNTIDFDSINLGSIPSIPTIFGERMSKKNLYVRLVKQDYRCFYCSKDLVPQHPGVNGKLLHNNPTIDHIVPKSEFLKKLKNNITGLHKNTLICCFQCNNERGDMNFIDFYLTKKEL